MKRWIPGIMFVLLCCGGYGQGKITVLVRGANIRKGGLLKAAIFEKGNFPKTGRHIHKISLEVKESNMQITFDQVLAGQYAIAVFQDEDRNGKLNTNLIGYPMEPFGFSNDAKVKFGPPSFEEAMIIVEDNKSLYLIIHLR